MAANNVTIVIPVYGAWAELKDCIPSLRQTIDPAKHRVMIVNDLGPEADSIEAHILKAIKHDSNFEYHRNPKNLGFLGNCNRAVLELDKTANDIVLLNSDTIATPGWLDEMQAVLYSRPDIGAVSPRSNNATICTIPLSSMSQKGIEHDKSYALFQKHKDQFGRFDEAPTAHGFCMLIRRSLIKKYGLFDPAFGAGYGEEVDFCQRLAKASHKSAICNRAYVFHMEARSFTPERKAKLLEKNNKIIRRRYPDYQQAVADYIAAAKTREAKIIGGPGPIAGAKQMIKRLFRSS